MNTWFAIELLLAENPSGFLKAVIAINNSDVTATIFKDDTNLEELLAEIENRK